MDEVKVLPESDDQSLDDAKVDSLKNRTLTENYDYANYKLTAESFFQEDPHWMRHLAVAASMLVLAPARRRVAGVASSPSVVSLVVAYLGQKQNLR